MIAKDSPDESLNVRMTLYLQVAGVLLIVEGVAFALATRSSPPDRPATFSLLTVAGLAFGLALAAAGIQTFRARHFWFAVAGPVALLVFDVAWGVTGGGAVVVGGIVTVLASLVLVVSGRPAFRD